MKNKFIALGCGLLMTFGLVTATACPSKVIASEGKNKEEIVINMNSVYKATYLHYASESLKEGFKQYALWYLDRVLDKEEKQYDHTVTLDQIVEATEEAVDRYATDESIRMELLNLAETIYEEQKIERATDLLKDILISENERHEKMGYDYIGSYFYHIWLIYNLEVKDAHSVEKAHEGVRACIKENDPTNYRYVDSILKTVEMQLPKGDSELIKKIKSYD